MRVILLPCVYVYRGVLVVLGALLDFIKHVFLGVAAFPTMIIKAFSKKNNEVIKTVKPTKNTYKKTDILLAEYKKEQAKRVKLE